MASIKLKKIIGYFLDEINGGKVEYARAYRIAVLGNKNLKWDITGKIAQVCIPVEDDRTAQIPDWLGKITKVGKMNHVTGKIVGLTQNNSLAFDTHCDTEDDEDNFPRENVLDNGEYYMNSFPPHSLGKGGYRNIGEYRISEEQGLIVLSPDCDFSEIVVEGIDTRDNEGDVCVNELLSEAILAFVRWRWHLSKKGVPFQDKKEYRNLWKVEKSNAKFRIKKPKLQDMNRIARQSDKFLKS